MKIVLRLLLALGVCAVLAVAVTPVVRVGGARVDVFAVTVVLGSIYLRPMHALYFAWGAGLTRDAFSQGPLGGYALLFLIAAFVILRVRAYAYIDTVPMGFMLATAVAAACATTYLLVLYLHYPHVALLAGMGRVPGEALCSGALAAAAVGAVLGWQRWRLARRRVRFG